jgi:mannose-1-phosphate guanylyltransferase
VLHHQVIPKDETGVGVLPREQLAAETLLSADAAIWAIVLAGGIGSRFWPLSSPGRPKQLLRLVGDSPLIAETVGRLDPLIPAERVLVVTSADIAPAIRAAIPGVPEQNMLVEPRPSGTAAAMAWGAFEVLKRAGPDTVVCALHADVGASFPDAFRHTVRYAGGIAAQDDLVVAIGSPASRAETGFGYLVPGAALAPDHPFSGGGAAFVRRFVEKPAAHEAEALIGAGAVWHTGISVWRARVLLELLRENTPEVGDALPRLEAGDPQGFAADVVSISIERGLFERQDRLVVIPADFGWDDVGTWASLKRVRELDDDGNGGHGSAHFVDASGNVAHSEGAAVVLYGVDNLLVVTLDGLTFVTTLDRAADLRPLLDALPERLRNRR